MKKMKMKRTGVEKLWKTRVWWKLLCKEDSLIETLETEGTRDESSGESADGVRALEVPNSDAEDETPGKDKRDFSEYSVETIDMITDNTWA